MALVAVVLGFDLGAFVGVWSNGRSEPPASIQPVGPAPGQAAPVVPEALEAGPAQVVAEGGPEAGPAGIGVPATITVASREPAAPYPQERAGAARGERTALLPPGLGNPATITVASREPAAPDPQERAGAARSERTALFPPGIGARKKPGPAWRRYAAVAPAAEGRPMIAIVIDDLGPNAARARRAIALDAPLTLSFLPYASGVEAQARAGRAAGHELLVHMPMEPVAGNDDPGPNALVIGLARDELKRRLEWALGRFDGFVGINNHMGSLFTRDREAMSWLLGEVSARGLLFLDSRTTAYSQGVLVAAEMGVAHAERHVFLDTYAGAEEVRARLKEVEAVARRQGYAVAIGHPNDVTLKALAEWLPSLEARGLAQAPLSAIVRLRQGGGGSPTAVRAAATGALN